MRRSENPLDTATWSYVSGFRSLKIVTDNLPIISEFIVLAGLSSLYASDDPLPMSILQNFMLFHLCWSMQICSLLCCPYFGRIYLYSKRSLWSSCRHVLLFWVMHCVEKKNKFLAIFQSFFALNFYKPAFSLQYDWNFIAYKSTFPQCSPRELAFYNPFMVKWCSNAGSR